MGALQENRPASVTTTLGDDVLIFKRLTAEEELGRLYQYKLELLSDDPAISMNDVLGKRMTVTLAVGQSGERHFNGVVASFGLVGMVGTRYIYEAILHPEIWLLTLTSNCFVYQGLSDMTGPGIVKEVLRRNGYTDIEESLTGDYRTIEYCVQYRETDFNFISRIMEQEGFYYYFKQEASKEKLVLADSASAHGPVSNYDTVPFFSATTGDRREEEHFNEFRVTNRVLTGAVALRDYDFENPRADMQVRATVSRQHSESDKEMYDYPGEYVTPSPDGQNYAKVQVETHQAEYERLQASGNVRALMPGVLFTLENSPREDLNKELLVIHQTLVLEMSAYESGGGSGEMVVRTDVTAMDSQEQYRSQRTTPLPCVQGPQTATVVGPSGETVWTDNYGRVKVQFHWDREGAFDENSSCWVRVSQNWAGKNYGGMFLPHLDQEVIVEFLEGDPDHPIITGRVYNANNMPPLALPDAKLKSIIRDNFGNQIVFDATPGEEHILIHSPHHQSSIEVGRSIRWKSETPTKIFSKEDWLEVVAGVKGTVTLGAKFGLTVGMGIDFTVGYKYSGHWGGKTDWFQGNQSSVFKGNKIEHVTGVKVSHTEASEIKINSSGFAHRSDAEITLDTLKDCIINAGPKDNSLIRMNGDAVLLDYGEDGSEAPTADNSKSALDARSAIKNQLATTIKGSAAAAFAMFAADATSNLFSDNDDKLPSWVDGVGSAFGTLGALSSGALWAEAKASSLDKTVIEMAVEDTQAYNSKSTQDKTYARVKLFADGARVAAFDSGNPDGDADAEIMVKKDGTILIKAKTSIELKTDDGDISIDSGGDVSIKGTNIKLEASGKVTADPKVENAG